MNAINTAGNQSFKSGKMAALSEPLHGTDLSIGNGFEAQSFRAQEVGQLMDPLVMVDHYVMTAPTFGAHPHAGMSAVSLLFEDSEGLFHNRDSLGNDFDLRPGDLYWLKAGSGAVHDESPRVDARTHGLQVFVNVPQAQRFEDPESILVRAEDMPVISNEEYRVKIALGESNGVSGAISPSIQMTILDGAIQPGGRFAYESTSNRGIWIQAVAGNLVIVVEGEVRSLNQGEALAVSATRAADIGINNPSHESVHFALFDGEQIDESYVQDGPFVMGSKEEIADIKVAYEAGQLGLIADSV